ncbi:endonuclease/exonuclease/phosphatase family protein [Roseovarius sp.]|uniref:endonuclease/exonuclease/phosphatase family protein n=1 Tax=Roseovarius sp. TaxID=1486281 RepID=UPI003A96A5E5
MRIATYNVEWFNALFDDQGRPYDDAAWSARYNVRRGDQLAAIGIVFTALDADVVLVVEAPDQNGRRSTVKALENFAKLMQLRARRAVIGFANETQQELALLYDPDVVSARHDPQGDPTPGASGVPRLDGVFRIDLDIDDRADRVQFSKPPLEIELITKPGRVLRLIGAHLKSKAPHGAIGRDEAIRIGIANRRKQLAQAVWLRQRIAEHLETGDSLVVLGDLNDGPGLDEYEHLFGRSSVEIIMGEGQDAALTLYDPHARDALSRRFGAVHATARFYLRDQRCYMQALLDYILISQDLMGRRPVWRIWHPFDDPECWDNRDLREALLAASDHFPVSLDFDF